MLAGYGPADSNNLTINILTYGLAADDQYLCPLYTYISPLMYTYIRYCNVICIMFI